MSPAEVDRKITAYNKAYKAKLKDKAEMDWLLANLIGISVGRCLSSDVTFPSVMEAYPAFFEEEEIEQNKQQQQNEINKARFMEFAAAHNLKYKQQVVNNADG